MNRPRLLFLLAVLTAPPAGAAMFEVAPGSSAQFEVEHAGNGRITGRIGGIRGTVQMEQQRQGFADMSFDMNAVDTGNSLINRFIKSSQVFDTHNYPTMRFSSTGFEFQGEQLVGASGMLTLHGVAQPIRLEVNDFSCADIVPAPQSGALPAPIHARHRCSGHFTTRISRSRFGMSRLSTLVDDEVAISVHLSLDRLDHPELAQR